MPKTFCGAKTRSSGECRQPAMKNGRCRLHGGKSLKGIESPSFKTGRHSKYMPKELLSAYQDAKQDTELLSVRAEIALMDVMLSGLLPKLNTGQSIEGWYELKRLIPSVNRAIKSGDVTGFKSTFETMANIINDNVTHYDTEHEIKDTIDTRRKLVETEHKIALQGERSISVEQLMLLMTQVLAVIQSVVKEEKQRYAIAVGLQDLLSLPNGNADTN